MSPESPIHRAEDQAEDQGNDFRSSRLLYTIIEEPDSDNDEHPKQIANESATPSPDIQAPALQTRTATTSAPTPTKPSLTATSAPATSPSPNSHPTIPLGRPPPPSKHYYLKEMWPGQPVCHLCRREYKRSTRAIRALPCGDIFHQACVDHLLGRVDSVCPSCRAEIPAGWYWPHVYDLAKPEGGDGGCVCCAGDKWKGAKTDDHGEDGGDASGTGSRGLGMRKGIEWVKSVGRWVFGRKAREFVGYKTESGQVRYFETEMEMVGVENGLRVG